MRRATTLALITAGTLALVAGGAFARARLRGRGSAIPKPVTGMFPNGMAYLRWGTGEKTLLWIPGGPGNVLPASALVLRMVKSWSRPFVEQGYTVWWVTRKQDMPKGHTFADMADDYGQLIADELGGKADVVLGMSTGGQIGFYLAARHSDRFGHIVIASAGYEDNERAKALLLPMARLLSEGRTGEAMAVMIEDAYPRVPGSVARVLGAVMGRSMYGQTHPHFANDVIVEAEAELACDARDVLPAIPMPVLLVCGDSDPYFPKEVCEETARLIPDCTLRLQKGKGHEMALSGAWFTQDVLDFVRQRPAIQPERGAERPTIIDQPAATSEQPATSGQPVGPSPVGAGAG
jgi:pimeloyl-ACP methyl ester carboxylesterase